ncbi:MAG: phospholipid carrier-dependent glycosyltransferase [bacterium]
MWLKNFRLNKYLIGILIVASILRFVNLGHPPVYIFDEVYHAFTAREYLAGHIEAWEWWTTPPEGVAYEWTHPGVAKYGMVLGMFLFGQNSFGWRVGSTAFGVVSILGLYLFVLKLTKNKSIALLSAFLVSIEGTHIAQSRVAMNDIYLLAFYIWALYAGVTSRWKTAAVLYGLALGSKWSALYGMIPLALIYLHQNKVKFTLSYLIPNTIYIIRLLLISSAVYVLTFAPFILAGHTWAQFIELHRQMWYYHTHLVATHAYQSTPREWIFAARPVWYWVDYAGDSISHIFVQGNPLILWLGLVAFVLQLTKFFKFPHLILNTLYLILVIPWIFSPRIMFYYHYLPSASFLCVILATWLSSLPPRLRNSLIIVCSIGLILVSPMLYGFPLPVKYWDFFFRLFPTWK